MDIHRTFAGVVFWEAGHLRPAGRVDMTRAGLEGFGRTLSKDDEVVVEATISQSLASNSSFLVMAVASRRCQTAHQPACALRDTRLPAIRQW